jgi:hypothetical protein
LLDRAEALSRQPGKGWLDELAGKYGIDDRAALAEAVAIADYQYHAEKPDMTAVRQVLKLLPKTVQALSDPDLYFLWGLIGKMRRLAGELGELETAMKKELPKPIRTEDVRVHAVVDTLEEFWARLNRRNDRGRVKFLETTADYIGGPALAAKVKSAVRKRLKANPAKWL